MTDTAHDPDDAATDAPDGDLHVDFGEELAPFASEFLVLVGPRGEILGGTGASPLGFAWHRRVGHHIAEHAHPDDLPRIYEVIERIRRAPGPDERLRVRARDAAGAWHVLDVRVFDARLRSGRRAAALRLRDVTDEAEPVGGGSPDRFSSLAEMLPLGILSADARGWVSYANAAAAAVLGRPADALLGEGWAEAVHADDRRAVVDAAAAALHTGTRCPATFRVASPPTAGPAPADRWGHARFAPVPSPDGPPIGWIATVEDVTERHRAEAVLAHRATHDPLTGLPNRLLLEDRLHLAGQRLRRGVSSVAVLFIDLDRFKDVNDRHGHTVGDVVLVEVARRLRATVRSVDTVARYGGDEFVAVCESPPGDDAAGLVARVAAALRPPVVVDGVALSVGASVGAAVATGDDPDVGALLARADQAMYREKVRRGGRPVG